MVTGEKLQGSTTVQLVLLASVGVFGDHDGASHWGQMTSIALLEGHSQ